MKGFEKYLQCSKRTDPDWTNHYINYTQLKFILKKYYRRRRAFGKMTRGTGMMDQKDMDLLFEKTDYNIKKPRMSLQIDVSGEEGESSGDYFRYEDPNNGEATSYLVQQDFSCHLWFACVLYISFCILLNTTNQNSTLQSQWHGNLLTNAYHSLSEQNFRH